MSVDANDILLSSGVKSASFKAVGDKITGVIARKPEVQQQRDIKTGEAKVWKDGKPALQIKVILSTDDRDPSDPDDTGERALYIKSGIQGAVSIALRKAHAKGLEVGGKLQVAYTGDEPAKPGLSPKKIYEAKYRAPEAEPVPVPELAPVEIEDSVPF